MMQNMGAQPAPSSGKGIFASIFGFITNSFGFIMLFILGLTVFRNRKVLSAPQAAAAAAAPAAVAVATEELAPEATEELAAETPVEEAVVAE